MALPMRCGATGHVLLMPGMRLQTPTSLDAGIAEAAGSDPQAQRWLGWKPQGVMPEPERRRLLITEAGRGRPGPIGAGSDHALIAIDPGPGRLIGYVGCDAKTGEIGGWLAPEFRGHGLGAVLFAGAAELGHRHLCLRAVIAGAESSNRACIGALTAAGFMPMPGPETHTLPNGRAIASSWFRHECDRPARCAR